MERAKLCIVLQTDRHDEVVSMLRSLIGPISISKGCLKCRLYQDTVEKSRVCWEEEWRTREDLYRHIASTQYLQILAALDLATKEPEVSFEHVSESLGMELIDSIRLNE